MPDRRDRQRSRDFPARREAPAPPPLPQLEVHFLPQAAAFENVAAQIKSGTIAYSVYALARLFCEAERYHVRVKTKEVRPLFRAWRIRTQYRQIAPRSRTPPFA